MQGGTSALDFLEDVGGGRGPDEGRGMLVVLGDVVVNGGDELVTLRNTPRRRRLTVRSRKNRSTMFSHDAEVGVK